MRLTGVCTASVMVSVYRIQLIDAYNFRSALPILPRSSITHHRNTKILESKQYYLAMIFYKARVLRQTYAVPGFVQKISYCTLPQSIIKSTSMCDD